MEALSPHAIALFDRMQRENHLPKADERGVRELEAFGLAVPDPLLFGQYRLVAPQNAERVFMSRQRSAIEEALQLMASGDAVFRNLPSDPQDSSPDSNDSGIEVISHKHVATAAISAACDVATSHVYTAHPIDRTPELLPASQGRDIPMLKRGVQLWTVYLHDARDRDPESGWAEAVSRYGAQIRTAEGDFTRMVIVDDKLVIIPDYRYPIEEKRAIKITNPALIPAFTEEFLQLWRRATPWHGGEFGAAPDVRTTPRQRRILNLLLEGADYDAIAKKLGTSRTTITTDIKKLYDLSGATTLFMLGAWWKSDAAKRDREAAHGPEPRPRSGSAE
ncbi:HTH domain-containing protein [Streptomyces sp. NPDC046275]|uniref:HTH domain-containing protein n=1 Tax=Streptomyces sp. NPDC046275 TaxID=3157201 RepID=UPI00340E0673